jgi:hypothetical protein
LSEKTLRKKPSKKPSNTSRKRAIFIQKKGDKSKTLWKKTSKKPRGLERRGEKAVYKKMI